MAFIPGYDHDIFVSYAHVDNAFFFDVPKGREQPSGWVSTLVDNLKKLLAQKFGRADACSLWFDLIDLRGNHTLTDEIATRVNHAALFVAILSRGYIESQWCQDEARLFGLTADDLKRRIFVVHTALRGGDIAVPPVLGGRRAYQFWYRDRNTQVRNLGMPAPHQDEFDYFRQIDDLACDLYDQCKVMRDERTRTPTAAAAEAPAAAPSVAPSAVLLAEVTDDLELKRAEVRRYLAASDVLVLPEQTYPLGSADFTAALDADLARSRLFVQLLGPLAGKRPSDLPDGYCWLQFESARRSVPILQWRSPELDPATIEWSRHREILELTTVRATSLESFKHAITDALTSPRPAPESRRGVANRPLVFLKHRAAASHHRRPDP
jgi:hypothetical protein